MAITASNWLNRIKTELRVSHDDDDARITLLIAEACDYLQRFKCETLVDAVTDPETQASLTTTDIRVIALYVGLQFDGPDSGTEQAMGGMLELARTK